jgi:acetyl esterase/lipase
VDPELAPLLDLIPPLSLSDDTLPAIRGFLAEMSVPPSKYVGSVDTSEQLVLGPVGAPDVRVVVSRPTHPLANGLPAVLWIHGGGYVFGRPEQNHALAEDLVAELGCVVVAVAYRLAPETPFPGPVEDCYAALQWIHSHAVELGVDADRVAVAGESAGGGLAAAVCLLARDRGGPAICHSLLIYPMLDDRTAVEDQPNPHTGQFVWTRADNAYGWASLLGAPPGGEQISQYAAPARATNLTGLPPTIVTVGTLDLFSDECLDFARRLMRAGVATELHVYAGAFHGFFAFDGSAVSLRHRNECFAALSRGFSRQ